MEKIDFNRIDESEKIAIFNEIATQKGMKPFAVEKDWWVSRTLDIIFKMPISNHLVFKGGTSLSKALKLINRFSEDIDLAIDKEFFGFEGTLSKNQRDKLRKTAGIYTTETFFKDLEQAFKDNNLTVAKHFIPESKDSDQDPRIIEIYYPNVIKPDTEYLQPRVQLEVSCRSLREPFQIKTFGSLVDETFSKMEFSAPLFDVPTVTPERTFLEKLFLLHEEFHRPANKRRVDRLSRHIYDIHQLNNAGIASQAISDKLLYETIVNHRYIYSRVGFVDYNLHHPQKLNPIPPAEVIKDWEIDYNKMMEDMIYDEKKPKFNELINSLIDIQQKLKAVEWSFELKFKSQ